MPRFLRVLLVFVLLVGAAAAGGMAVTGWYLSRPLPITGNGYSFDVRHGSTLKVVARDLAAAGVLRHELPLIALARWRGVDRNIKAGNYDIPAGTTLSRLLDRLTQGDVNLATFTIVEGSTFADVKRGLANNGGVLKTVLDLPDAEIMARLGSQQRSAEGWLFPETYFFSTGSTDVSLLKRAHALMVGRLEAAWAQRAPNLPLASPYEALVLASIVEKETGRGDDRPLVASVFINRLRIGMRLQTDPTVIYGMGERFDGNLHRRDLDTDTPYNTYTREGLPPTPIAFPGLASIDAVLHPPRTDYLYFVARGDGRSQFSTNLADHSRAVAKFQKTGR